jgi:hypothetical protein
MTPGIRFAVLLSICFALGCDRQLEPYVPGEQPHAPDLSRIFPEGAQRAQQNAGAAQGEASAGRRGAPPVGADSGAPIRGTVVVAPELADQIPAGAVLFLFVRHGEAGAPLAVKRIEGPRFPLPFELGPEDRMITTVPFLGPLRLTARLDADGIATTSSPGDLEGVVAEALEPGTADVEVVIDQAL